MFRHAFPAIKDFANLTTKLNLRGRMFWTKELLWVELKISVVI
jgi:hypothetical protein